MKTCRLDRLWIAFIETLLGELLYASQHDGWRQELHVLIVPLGAVLLLWHGCFGLPQRLHCVVVVVPCCLLAGSLPGAIPYLCSAEYFDKLGEGVWTLGARPVCGHLHRTSRCTQGYQVSRHCHDLWLSSISSLSPSVHLFSQQVSIAVCDAWYTWSLSLFLGFACAFLLSSTRDFEFSFDDDAVRSSNKAFKFKVGLLIFSSSKHVLA